MSGVTSDSSLPGDWVDQVLRAYVAFGVESLDVLVADGGGRYPFPDDWEDRVARTSTVFAESTPKRTQQSRPRRAAPRAGERWEEGQEDPEWVRRTPTGQFGPGARARLDLTKTETKKNTMTWGRDPKTGETIPVSTDPNFEYKKNPQTGAWRLVEKEKKNPIAELWDNWQRSKEKKKKREAAEKAASEWAKQKNKEQEEKYGKPEDEPAEKPDKNFFEDIGDRIAGLFGRDTEPGSEPGSEEPKPQQKPKIDHAVPPDKGRKEPIQSLTGEKAEKMLVEAGYKPELAKRYAIKGTIHTRDGESFVLTLNEETKQKEYENAVKYDGMTYPYSKFQKTPEQEKADTEAILNRLEYAMAARPEWAKTDKNGNQVPMITEINDVMAYTERVNQATGMAGGFAGAVRDFGDNHMYLRSGMQDNKTQRLMFGRETDELEITINHEMGHTIDSKASEYNFETRQMEYMPHSSMTDENVAFWQQWKDHVGMSQYGSSAEWEGYAETYLKWSTGVRNPVVEAYAERFGWEKKQR